MFKLLKVYSIPGADADRTALSGDYGEADSPMNASSLEVRISATMAILTFQICTLMSASGPTGQYY